MKHEAQDIPSQRQRIGHAHKAVSGMHLHPSLHHAVDQDWSTQGLCVTSDPDELFVRGAQQRVDARLCRSCPVRIDCLADALDHRVEWGVWGGMTERERRALLRRRPEVHNWREELDHERMEPSA